MIHIRLKNYRYMVVNSEIEYQLSEYVSWLILNVGERNNSWGVNRDINNNRAVSVWFTHNEDGTAFKLRFGL